MHTEAQARQTWCPFARSMEGGDGNREWKAKAVALPADCMCVASQCMAWRWAPQTDTHEKPQAGFCGIAGSAGWARG
jgi:hypothetical protein